MDSIGTDSDVKEIINYLGWRKFCGKTKEGVLQVVKEFYVNLEERVDGKVFVRGKWVDVSSMTIINLIGPPKYEEDDYSVLMEEGIPRSWSKIYINLTRK